jgi:hypothetical protein
MLKKKDWSSLNVVPPVVLPSTNPDLPTMANEREWYTVQETAVLIGWSEKKTRQLLANDRDVQKLPGPGAFEGTAKRGYVTLRVPKSSIERIIRQLTQPAPKPVVFARTPRIIRKLQRPNKNAAVGVSAA